MQITTPFKHALSILLFCIFSLSFLANAQQIDQQNLSSIEVDELSDQQIKNILSQVKSSGVSESQAEQMLLSHGLPANQAFKFKQRVAQLKTKREESEYREENEFGSKAKFKKDLNYDSVKSDEKSKVFGSQIFSKSYSNLLELNPNRPTPKNYILGPSDELQVNVFGNSVANWTIAIKPEGYASLPGMGAIYLSGKTIEEGRELISNKLRENNYSIGRGTDVTISLTNIRSIQVSIIGEVKRPGAYTMTSLQTVLNALYTSGGPTDIGSFRQIEVIRDNRVLSTFDVYDVLLSGNLANNIYLQDDDIIRVPVSKVLVSTAGAVKRPGLYEMLPGETFAKVLQYSGGFTDSAYTEKVKVIQVTSKEKSVKDIDQVDFNNYVVLKGDSYRVDTILNRFANRVTIKGAVFRPGQFELSPGLTLSQLIQQAEGLKEDAFSDRGYITRLTADNHTEVVPFNVSKMAQGTANDIPLQREDVIHIPSLFDLKDEQSITINGRVRNGGQFPFSTNLRVEDLILMAGGLKEGASTKRIEVSRRLTNFDVESPSLQSAEIFTVNVNSDLSIQDDDFRLHPFDIITIRPEAGYETQKQVLLEGEVRYPGTYTIQNKTERISDVIARAGGLTTFAYQEGASLERGRKKEDTLLKDVNELSKSENEEEAKLANLRRLSEKNTASEDHLQDSLEIENLISSNLIGIDLVRILKTPKRLEDLILEDGDILRIPKELQTVKVNGEVLRPNQIVYKPGKSFKHYLNGAGGFTQDALKKGSYIQYANGSVDATSNFLFFRNYPTVKPGSEIFVPKRAPREKMSAQGWVGVSTAVVSMAALIFNLVK